MTWAVSGALIVAAALLQVAWGPQFEIFGAFPNLVLLLVGAYSWRAGPRAGMTLACAGGLLLDLTGAGPLGPHALALLPGAYAIGLAPRYLERPNPLVIAGGAAAMTLVYSAVLAVAHATPLGVAVRLALAAAMYNAPLAPLVFAMVRSLFLGRISRRAQA